MAIKFANAQARRPEGMLEATQSASLFLLQDAVVTTVSAYQCSVAKTGFILLV